MSNVAKPDGNENQTALPPEKAAKFYAAWLTFEDRLAKRARDLARGELVFSSGRQCIPGFPFDGFRADAAITNGRVLLAIEVEVRQTHPDTNVGKYWLLSKYKTYEKIVLFHVYTPAYNSYGWRKTLGEFYAEQMRKEAPFEYFLFDRRHRHAALDVDATLEEIYAAFRDRVHVEFAHELGPTEAP